MVCYIVFLQILQGAEAFNILDEKINGAGLRSSLNYKSKLLAFSFLEVNFNIYCSVS
jgi:hypothetical protein